jgi:hypothetical protein
LVVRRLAVVLFTVLALVLGPWPATASPHDPGHDHGVDDRYPARIDLPNGFAPEGIERGRGRSVFVGSVVDGAIWRGDLRTGSGAVIAEGAAGRASLGMAYERREDRLWVAGAGPGFGFGRGDVRVYDASSGELLESYLPPGEVGALNDVAITADAVFVTDSFNPQLVRIPLPEDGSLPSENAATLLPVTGDFAQTEGQPNLNGIVARCGALVVAQTSTGTLFRVDPETGIADEVELRNGSLPRPDGLELRRNTLYVVGGGMVTVVRLRDELARGTVRGVITDPGEPGQPLLDVPTTATVAADRLWVVNARFTTERTPGTEYWITRLPLRPDRR